MSGGGQTASRIGYIGAACSLVAVFAASSSPIPLYELYRRTDGLSHADLSVAAVAYFLAVMVALVVLGRLSNHVGRRPSALAAPAVTAAGTAQGTTFAGSMRALLAHAAPPERAGVLSAIYLIATAAPRSPASSPVSSPAH